MDYNSIYNDLEKCKDIIFDGEQSTLYDKLQTSKDIIDSVVTAQKLAEEEKTRRKISLLEEKNKLLEQLNKINGNLMMVKDKNLQSLTDFLNGQIVSIETKLMMLENELLYFL